MKNYSRKTNKKQTRFRTPSRFIALKAKHIKSKRSQVKNSAG